MGNHIKKEEKFEDSNLGLYAEDLVIEQVNDTNIDFYNDKKTNKIITFFSMICSRK